MLAAAISGFLLVGPVFAAGFYELSRLRGAGEAGTFDRAIQGAVRKAKALASLGLLLAVIAIAWVWVSTLLFERAFGAGAIPPARWGSYQTVVDWNIGTGFLLTYLLTGAVFALIAFVLSSVSAPMMFDRSISMPSAVVVSARVTAANPVSMAVWAILVAVLTIIGFATMLFGLIVVLPVLGHATWHAYRDLICSAEGTAAEAAGHDRGADFSDIH
jgi:uncharacterized membrane protein